MKPSTLFWMSMTLLSMACFSDKEEGPEGMGGQEGEAFDLDGGTPGMDDGGGNDNDSFDGGDTTCRRTRTHSRGSDRQLPFLDVR